jgi:hypothetical protein
MKKLVLFMMLIVSLFIIKGQPVMAAQDTNAAIVAAKSYIGTYQYVILWDTGSVYSLYVSNDIMAAKYFTADLDYVTSFGKGVWNKNITYANFNGSYGTLSSGVLTGTSPKNKIIYCNYDIPEYSGTTTLTGNTYYPAIDMYVAPIPEINIIAPSGSNHGGIGVQIPYSFNVNDLSYSGNIHYAIKVDSVLATNDIISKDAVYNADTQAYIGKFTLDIGTGNYLFYVDITYNDGTQSKTLHSEKSFAVGMDLNTVNGQDVVTGNSAYNNMLKFTTPVYGQLYDYGQPESYTITADKSYYDSETGMPLEQYLPPIPDQTGNWQQDQIALEARGMVYIVQNGQLNDSLKVSLQEFYKNDVTKNFPWYKNNGIASTGENDIVLVSVLNSPVKTEFYNYYLTGGTVAGPVSGWYHIYAGSKFIIGDEDIGIVNPSIPVVGGSQLPLRGDYPDGVLGAVEYGFATLMSYLTFPIKLIVGGLTYIITILGELVGQATGLSAMMGTFFSFLPIEVRNLMSLSIVSALIYTAYKMIRGQ